MARVGATRVGLNGKEHNRHYLSQTCLSFFSHQTTVSIIYIFCNFLVTLLLRPSFHPRPRLLNTKQGAPNPSGDDDPRPRFPH